MNTPKLSDAVFSLLHDPKCVIRGNSYAGLEWFDDRPQPTEAEVAAELSRLQAEYAAKEYQRKRASAYPDYRDYLDGIVKGDAAQVQKYIADCLAVKARFPK